jgi:hypothetical protein
MAGPSGLKVNKDPNVGSADNTADGIATQSLWNQIRPTVTFIKGYSLWMFGYNSFFKNIPLSRFPSCRPNSRMVFVDRNHERKQAKIEQHQNIADCSKPQNS